MNYTQGAIIAITTIFFASTATYAENIGAPPACGLYTYKAKIMRVIDGDTVVSGFDLGFRTWLHDEHLRLYGIDAPERGTDQFAATTDALKQRIEGKSVYVCTIKAKRSDKESTGSFGRYLVTVHVDGQKVNDWLVSEGLAIKYK